MRYRLFFLMIAAAVLTLLNAAESRAQQTFELSMKLRVASLPQTASVKIEFENTGNIPGPPSITVDDENVPNGMGMGQENVQAVTCGAVGCNGLGGFGPNNADSSLLVWQSATKATLVLNFADFTGGNLCLSSRTGERKFTITVSNINATGYRIASYGVPELKTADNPSPKCDNPFRRINGDQATLAQTAGTTATNNHRLPIDVVLVLDKSGSMGSQLANAPAGVTRWDRLKESVGQFMNLYNQATHSLPDGTTVEGQNDDRVGLVFFDSTAAQGALDGSSIFKTRGSGWISGLTDVISAKLGPPAPGQVPGGSTSIGGGLALSFDCLGFKDCNPANPDPNNKVKLGNDATVVLFTDGEQNTAPCVLAEGEADNSGCTTAGTIPLYLKGTKLRDRVTPVLSIGFGAGGTPFADLLDHIGHDTAGQSRVTMDSLALDTSFADSLVGLLKGNTISLLKRQLEPLPASGNGTTLSTMVDGSITRVVFVAGWEGVRSARMFNLAIKNPGGTVVAPVVIARGDSYIVASVDTMAAGSAGQWQAQFVKAFAENLPNVRYHLSAYAVEGRLDYRLSVKEAPFGTGQPVVVRAEIAYDGKSLDHLPAGAVTVTALRPGENLGNILNDSTATGTVGNEGPTPGSPVSAKIDELVKSGNLLDRIEPKPLPTTLTMTEVGGGVYEASFDQTVVGGQYRFKVDLNWTDARTTQIARNELLEQHVPVLPDQKDTVVQVLPAGTTAQVLVTPKDRFGNFVGPGYGKRFVVTVDAPVAIGGIVNPGINGTYTIPLTNVTPGSDPHVKITYAGTTLADGTLSSIASSGGIPWWVWLIILLILILIAIYIWKKTHP